VIDIPVLLLTFMMDARTQLLFALIALDLVTGVMCALRSGSFQFAKLALFYRTNVVPYILGWFVIFTFGQLGITVLFGQQWGDIVAGIGYAPAVVTLTASIAENVGSLRQPPAEQPHV
jgi:hypothetical protein